MKKLLVLFISIFISFISFGQNTKTENLYHLQNHNKTFSFYDKSGKKIFSLDSLDSYMVNGVPRLKTYYYKGKLYISYPMSSKLKVYDNLGKSSVLTSEFGISEKRELFKYGKSVVYKYEKGISQLGYGIVDSAGKITLPISRDYRDLNECGEGLFAYKIKDSIQIIDASGNILFAKHEKECEGYTHNFKFREGLSVFSKNSQAKYLDKGSEYEFKSYTSGKKGYINLKGEQEILPTFDFAYPFNEGLALVGNNIEQLRSRIEICWFIDKKGQNIFRKKFGWVSLGTYDPPQFSDGLANVMDLNTKKSGYINLKGQWAIKPIYKKASIFSDGLGMVLTFDNKTKIINKNGLVILEGYWGDSHDLIWWDKNLIYIDYFKAYFNHKGEKVIY